MELSQGKIIQKPKKLEFSSLFMTHRLNVMHAPVKFHEYIPYPLGVMARTQSETSGQTERQSDGCTEQTEVTLNALSTILRIGGGIKTHKAWQSYLPDTNSFH